MSIKEISSRNEWERFWGKVSPQSFFQSWLWGEVEKRLGKKVWRFGCYQNKKLVGISCVVKMTSKKGTYLHVRHGPIFAKWDTQSFTGWLNRIKKLTKEEKASFVRISPLISVQLQLLTVLGFRPCPMHNQDAEITQVLDLAKSEEELLFSMRKTTRYLIRKAEKLGVRVTADDSKKQFDRFMKLFRQSAKRIGFIADRGLEEEFDIFASEKKVLVFLAYYQKQLLSGALIIFSGNQGIYHFAATADYMRNIPASYILQWEAIRETKKRGLRYYNLWGGIADSSNHSHPWYGLTLFKQGFGGKTISYQHALDLPIDAAYWKTYILEKLIKYIRGYEPIGPFRSPHWLRRLIGV